LLDMPGRVLPTVLARREVLNQVPQLTSENYNGTFTTINAAKAQQRLDKAVARWQARHAATGWQGRTWSGWQTARELNGRD
jgi:hypothetical protein